MVIVSYAVSLFYFISMLVLLSILLIKKRYKTPALSWLLSYMILSFLVFVILALIRSAGPTNLYISLYTILEFIITGQILDCLVEYKNKRVFKIIRWSYVLFVFLLIIFNNIHFEDNLWVAGFASLLLIIQCLITINKYLHSESADHLKQIAFWLILSIFFLHIFSIPIVIYDYYLFNAFFLNSTLITRISNFSVYILFHSFLIISINRLC